jgi:hypothetical protein
LISVDDLKVLEGLWERKRVLRVELFSVQPRGPWIEVSIDKRPEL